MQAAHNFTLDHATALCTACGAPVDSQYFDESSVVLAPVVGETVTLAEFELPPQYCGVLEYFAQFTDEYARDNSPRPEAAIRSEIRRFILWPAQATSYKIGAMKILSLREEAKRELGARFDIRRFHDTVIDSGGLPLSVLERRVKAWVEAEARR